MNRITTAQKTLEYYVVLSGESTPPVPTPTQVTIDGNFEIEQSGSTYTMSFGIQNFDWSSLESGWTGTVVYGHNTLTFDSSNLNNNTITISVSESQIDLTATTATMEITSGTDLYEGTANVEVGFVDYMFVENTYAGSNTITFTTTSTEPVTGTYADSIEYSKDKTVWTNLTFVPGTPQTVILNQGEKLYLRNSSGNFNSSGYYTSIKGSESHDAGGDIMTLVDYTSQNPTVTERCFYYLFFNNTGLVSASLVTMPSTTNSFSFTYMFRGCTALTTAPTLPATTLVSNCYNAMFQGCTELTTAPALPATTLGGFCYRSMFYGCTALTTAPALPATTLVSGCYRSMFNGCTSLTATPVLPATTLTNNCYYDMFNGCTSLNEVTTYADDISATGCTENWLLGVANSGTFYNYGTATYTSGASGIPSGWTVTQ